MEIPLDAGVSADSLHDADQCGLMAGCYDLADPVPFQFCGKFLKTQNQSDILKRIAAGIQTFHFIEDGNIGGGIRHRKVNKGFHGSDCIKKTIGTGSAAFNIKIITPSVIRRIPAAARPDPAGCKIYKRTFFNGASQEDFSLHHAEIMVLRQNHWRLGLAAHPCTADIHQLKIVKISHRYPSFVRF